MVLAQTTKYLALSFQPAATIFSVKTIVFATESHALFAILHSSLHYLWCKRFGSTLGDSTISYTIANCFENFPLPYSSNYWLETKTPDSELAASEPLDNSAFATLELLEGVGIELDRSRKSILTSLDIGFTEFYNLMKLPDENNLDELRFLHEQIDRTVLNAYGWSDIEVPPYLTETLANLDKTASTPETRTALATWTKFSDTILDRLFALNTLRAQAQTEG